MSAMSPTRPSPARLATRTVRLGARLIRFEWTVLGGVAPRARNTRVLLGIAAMAMSLCVTASTSFADVTHPLLGSFDGTGSTDGKFIAIQRGAVSETSGRVYVFDFTHAALDQFDADGVPQPWSDPSLAGASSLPLDPSPGQQPDVAVDNSGTASDGNIYVATAGKVYGFDPTGHPLSGFPIVYPSGSFSCGVDVDRSGHLWVMLSGSGLQEYSSNGTALAGHFSTSGYCHFAFDQAGNLYAARFGGSGVSKFVPDATHTFVPDPDTPIFDAAETNDVAVDPANNHVFVAHDDVVQEYTAQDDLVAEIGSGTVGRALGVTVRGASGRLYVIDSNGAKVFDYDTVFTPGVPQFTSLKVKSVDTGSATIQASIGANGSSTTYHVDYGPTVAYGSSTPESSSIGADYNNYQVTIHLTGLQSGQTYHLQLVAHNSSGTSHSVDRVITADSPPAPETDCPNQVFRIGYGANLLDCRAYELVTPIDLNNLPPTAFGTDDSGWFASDPAGAADRLIWSLHGRLPGTDSNGFGNRLRTDRGANGWSSALWEPKPDQSAWPGFDGFSANGETQVFKANGNDQGPVPLPRYSGSLAIGAWELAPHYIEWGDGTFQLAGQGLLPASPDTDGYDDGKLDDVDTVAMGISADGTHVALQTGGEIPPPPEAPLTSDAVAGVQAVYDRTESSLKLVSVLPNGTTPNSNSQYQGMSANGRVILFKNSNNLYARVGGATTESIVSGGTWEPGGVSDDGNYVFLWYGGDVFRYDTTKQTFKQITTSHDALMVLPSADGKVLYFLSTSQLDGSKGVIGLYNLYQWDGSAIHFIATVSGQDISHGLSAWASPSTTSGVVPVSGGNNLREEPARTTPDGHVLFFESRAHLTSANNGPHFEIYRWSSADGSLTCVSCATSGEDPEDDAQFQSQGTDDLSTNFTWVRAISDDGKTAFFQTTGRLVPGDTNDALDVYEWHDGTVSLISDGAGQHASALIGTSADAKDVFFRTADPLTADGQEDGATAIYDARVGGGFARQVPQTSSSSCAATGCQSNVTSPPAPLIGTVSFTGAGNATPHRRSAGSKITVKLRSLRVRGTKFKLTVKAPRAGTITLSGARITTVRKRATKAGSYTLTVRLSKATIAQLKHAKRLVITVRVAFAPTAGKRAEKTVTLTAIGNASAARKRGAGR